MKRQWERGMALGWALGVFFCALLLTGCASIHSTKMEYVGVRHHPPSNPATIELLQAEPTRPHERLGEISIDASTRPAPSITEIEERLRKKAAQMGADAVFIVYDRVQPVGLYVTGGYWNQDVWTIKGRVLVGVAIKYK